MNINAIGTAVLFLMFAAVAGIVIYADRIYNRLIDKAYDAGYGDGYRDAVSAYETGYEAGRRDALLKIKSEEKQKKAERGDGQAAGNGQNTAG